MEKDDKIYLCTRGGTFFASYYDIVSMKLVEIVGITKQKTQTKLKLKDDENREAEYVCTEFDASFVAGLRVRNQEYIFMLPKNKDTDKVYNAYLASVKLRKMVQELKAITDKTPSSTLFLNMKNPEFVNAVEEMTAQLGKLTK